MVDAEGFGDLLADGHDRVEGGHGLLKDHGEALAAVAAHGGFGEGEEVLPGEADRAGEGSGGGEKAEEGERGGGLARAGFPDQAEGLAGGNGERDAVHGGLRAEADVEVVDFEERGH